MDHPQSFEYIYSAEQRKEVEAIRNEYLPREEDKMEKLRRLHNSATQKAQAWSIAVGVIGVLMLGAGMSFCMTDLGASLGSFAMVVGVVIGILGIVLVALAYPGYHRTLRKERRRITPEILRLTEELMQ